MTVARYYAPYNQEDPANPAFIYGVPLRDIEEWEWEQLPEYLKESADASGLYLKSKPPEKKVKAAEREAAKAEEAAQAAQEE